MIHKDTALVQGSRLFTLTHRGSENSPLLIVFSAKYIDSSNRNLCKFFGSFDILTF